MDYIYIFIKKLTNQIINNKMQKRICNENLERLEKNTNQLHNKNLKIDYQKLCKILRKELNSTNSLSDLKILDYKIKKHLKIMDGSFKY